MKDSEEKSKDKDVVENGMACWQLTSLTRNYLSASDTKHQIKARFRKTTRHWSFYLLPVPRNAQVCQFTALFSHSTEVCDLLLSFHPTSIHSRSISRLSVLYHASAPASAESPNSQVEGAGKNMFASLIDTSSVVSANLARVKVECHLCDSLWWQKDTIRSPIRHPQIRHVRLGDPGWQITRTKPSLWPIEWSQIIHEGEIIHHRSSIHRQQTLQASRCAHCSQSIHRSST